MQTGAQTGVKTGVQKGVALMSLRNSGHELKFAWGYMRGPTGLELQVMAACYI